MKKLCGLILLLLSGFTQTGLAQCNAAFVYTIGAGGSCTFQSTSSPTVAGSTYSWSFGNGNTIAGTGSTFVTVFNTYSSNGVYLVSLTYTSGSCSDTAYQYVMINGIPGGTCTPSASLTASLGNSLTNNYTSISSGTTGATTYSWNYGDGSTGFGAGVAHTYSAAGVYTVYLTAMNSGTACVNSTSMAVTAGIVDFTSAFSGFNTFTLNSTSAPTGTNTVYSWNFGNGQSVFTATGTTSATVSYTSNGAYPVTLQINNPNAFYSGSITKTLVVTSYTNPSSCNLNAGFSYNQYNGGINFVNTSAGTYSGTVFNWSFGDNSFSTTTSPAHSYSAAGVYTVQLFAYNPAFSASCSSVFTQTVSVCSLSISSLVQSTLGPVSFTGTPSPAGSNVFYNWAFGNGNTTAGTNFSTVNTTYTNVGVYTVTCSISSTVPACSISATTIVNTSCSLNPSFSYTLGSNGAVNFASTSSGVNGSTNYSWDFGDGSPVGSGQSTGHTYSATGTYTVLLSLNNGFGCVSSTAMPVSVNIGTCSANFTLTSISSGTVTFLSTSSGVSGSTTYSWNYGNGLTYSVVASPTAMCTYTAPGGYFVTLTISDATTGCASSYSQFITVPGGTCGLLAIFNPTAITQNSFTFTNLSIGTLSTNTSYTWDYGDGQYSFGTNGNHSYSSNGQYTVSLFASNNGSWPSCTSDTSMVINVNFTCNILANFSHTVGTSGVVNFSNLSTLPNSINMTRRWNFGDGIISTSYNPSHTYINAGSYLVSLKLQDSVFTSCGDSVAQYINITGIPCNAISNFTMLPAGTPGHWLAVPNYPWNVSAATWSWGDGSTTDSLYTSHQYSASGTYSICLTVTASCGSVSSFCLSKQLNKGEDESAAIQFINVVPPQLGLSIREEVVQTESHLFPNPNKGTFYLNMVGVSEEPVRIFIFDVTGTCVFQESFVSSEPNVSKELSLDDRPNGIYFLRLINGSRSVTKKLIIER